MTLRKLETLDAALDVLKDWPDSNHYSMHKPSWQAVLVYMYSSGLGTNLHTEGGMFFTDEGDGRFEDLHYMVCAHPAPPNGVGEMVKAFALMSTEVNVFTQGMDAPSEHGYGIETGVAVLPDGGMDQFLATLSTSKRSALRRALRTPYLIEWNSNLNDWAMDNYMERWKEHPWAPLQMLYARSLVFSFKAIVLQMFMPMDNGERGPQVAECYFIVHNGGLKFIAASFAQGVNSIGMASQMEAIKYCYEQGYTVYDPSEVSNYEEWDYNAYKAIVTNEKRAVYCYAGTPDQDLSAPYCLNGDWCLVEHEELG